MKSCICKGKISKKFNSFHLWIVVCIGHFVQLKQCLIVEFLECKCRLESLGKLEFSIIFRFSKLPQVHFPTHFSLASRHSAKWHGHRVCSWNKFNFKYLHFLTWYFINLLACSRSSSDCSLKNLAMFGKATSSRSK